MGSAYASLGPFHHQPRLPAHAVASTANGLDEVGRVTELGTNLLHMHVNGAEPPSKSQPQTR